MGYTPALEVLICWHCTATSRIVCLTAGRTRVAKAWIRLRCCEPRTWRALKTKSCVNPDGDVELDDRYPRFSDGAPFWLRFRPASNRMWCTW